MTNDRREAEAYAGNPKALVTDAVARGRTKDAERATWVHSEDVEEAIVEEVAVDERRRMGWDGEKNV